MQSLFNLEWLPRKVREEEKQILLDERILLVKTQITKLIHLFETKNSKVHEIQVFRLFPFLHFLSNQSCEKENVITKAKIKCR